MGGPAGQRCATELRNDWYESVRLCLGTLYERVVSGGLVVIDDYCHWRGCRQAVDEFSDRTSVHFTEGPYPTAYARP